MRGREIEIGRVREREGERGKEGVRWREKMVGGERSTSNCYASEMNEDGILRRTYNMRDMSKLGDFKDLSERARGIFFITQMSSYLSAQVERSSSAPEPTEKVYPFLQLYMDHDLELRNRLK